MENIKFVIEKSTRIQKLIDNLYENMPEIESARGKLVTESYKATENLPIIKRRSAAFAHILRNIPIVIRDGELIVGIATVAPRGCQVFPEYSYEWLLSELCDHGNASSVGVSEGNGYKGAAPDICPKL